MKHYDVENPAYADACIYGNRFPIDKRSYEEDEEDFYRIKIDVDTRNLTVDEEENLYGDLDDIYISSDYRELYDFIGFEVEEVELPEFKGTEQFGLFKIRGIVPEATYDEICGVLDMYDVDWKG